jgi:aminopeptidase-like protein
MGLSSAQTDNSGAEMMRFIKELYPICRSITGEGARSTLARIDREVPLSITEIPSGTRVFDWTVPKEWNMRGGYLDGPDGRRIVDFRDHNLHVLNYSVPVDKQVSRDDLEPHLFSLPDQPDLIPYRTSYYQENWGFCLPQRQRETLGPGSYHAFIDSDLSDGALTLGEVLIPGELEDEVLIWSHICHPSIANDNLSGLAITTWWAKHLAKNSRPRYSYRFVWGPGTIGSITWLAQNQERIPRIRHGMVAVLLGRPGAFHLKQSRRGNTEIDRLAERVLADTASGVKTRDFDPYGYDERQFCSPGIDLPLCRLSRAPNGEYPEYHTSADNLDLVSAAALDEALAACISISDALDANRVWINRAPMGEPQLGKRGLYHATGGTNPKAREHAMLWMLNQSDGARSLLDIAERSGLDLATLGAVAAELEAAGLLSEAAGKS